MYFIYDKVNNTVFSGTQSECAAYNKQESIPYFDTLNYEVNSFTNSLLNKIKNRVRYFELFEDFGYFPTKQYIYMAVNLPTVFHEIAHIVERKNIEKLTLMDFGLKIFSSENKPSITQLIVAAACEARVRAISAHYYNKPYEKISKHVVWPSLFKSHLPYGRFKTDKDIVEWLDNIQETAFNSWNQDRIEYEWNIRTDYILNWMEYGGI